ncbi:hypothetical protein AURDEDRAFT_184110 [Auricularia subglabra TFB-10046 SS5]|nr:hypothetical protein AURDEDRAFT_184110 [Auricularia subglabra TFB-10046 SS5]
MAQSSSSSSLPAPLKAILKGIARLKRRSTSRRQSLAPSEDLPVILPLPSPSPTPPPHPHYLPSPELEPQPLPVAAPTLDTLTPELIVQILDYADVPSILRCSAVCRRFRDIVASSSPLQYRVTLDLAGLEDAGRLRTSYGDRLRALQSRQAAWRTFEYRDRVTLDIGPGAYRPCYDLHGGVFFVGRRTGPNLPIRMLSWLPLPSAYDPPGEPPDWTSVPLDVSIDDFALDLHQDLVVLVEMLLPAATTLTIHLRSFETMQPHPRADTGIIVSDCEPVSMNSTVVIDLTGQHLGLLFNYDHAAFSEKDTLTIWNWNTSQMLCRLQGTHTKVTSFSFLSEDIFLLPNVGNSTIETYRRCPDGFTLSATYELPPQSEGCLLNNANSRYKSRGVFKPPAESPWAREQRPFFLASEMELVVLSLEYRAKAKGNYFTLIAPKGAFLRPGAGAGAGEPPTVPWDAWGPGGARIIREPLRLWDYFFAGTRFMTLTAESAGGVDDEDSAAGEQRPPAGARTHVRLLDFSQAAVAHAPLEAATATSPTRRLRVVRTPNVVRAGPVFREDVLTSFPYVETVTTCAFELSNIMCDHERVIGLKTNAVLDMESMDVFLL